MSTAIETYTLNNEWVLMTAPQDAYTWHFKQFEKWMKAGGRELNYSSLLGYFKSLDESGYAANTVRISRQSVKHRLRLLMRSADVDTRTRMNQALQDLDADCPPPKINTNAIGRDKWLSRQEVQVLIDKARSQRQICFIKFLFNSGARVSEMCGIKIGHCKREGDVVDVRLRGKGNKERHIQISGKLYDSINEVFSGEEFLFETMHGRRYCRCYISSQIKRLGRYALGKNISAHTMRHSKATDLVKSHPDKLEGVSRFLGHSSPSITINLYVHTPLDPGLLIDEEI